MNATSLEAARESMIDNQLVYRGISNPRVLEAMRKVPREHFLPKILKDRAYEDCALPIGHGQTISQPYIVALTLHALNPQSHECALEVGSGCGYMAALLSTLVKKVYAIEIVKPLADRARKDIETLGMDNVEVLCADGSQGLAEHAPFDAIVVSAATAEIPPPLVEQLSDEGRMVLPLGPETEHDLLLLKKAGNELERHVLTKCIFVPLVHS